MTKKSFHDLPKTNIKIELDLHNFGVIQHKKPVKTYFHYSNIGEETLKITEVISPCGCTVPQWSKNELPPGKTDSLLVVFDASVLGNFSKSLHIKSNAIGSPHVFYIRGYVEKN